MKKGGLGKGLSALIPNIGKQESEKGDEVLKADTALNALFSRKREVESQQGGIEHIDVNNILPNHDQPRRTVKDETIEELASSLKEKGLIQPIIVTRRGDKHELVCGERRLNAAKKAGFATIPAIVKEVIDEDLLELALIENVQREDLNPLEEASAYLRLYEERGLSQEEVAAKVGKDRSTITNTMRLLRLPDSVRQFISQGLLSMGHARALLALPTEEYQKRFAERIAKENLSVRQVEDLIQKVNRGKRRARRARNLDGHILDIERKLEEKLGTQVKIFANKNNQGRLEIRYFSLDDLDRILSILGISRD